MSNYSYIDPAAFTGKFFIFPFSYQSRGIPFAEWTDLITLCLAPLIAHVFGGSPNITYLTTKRPRWHERVWQYNPTSILWRYFIIADRRLRAKSWTVNQMAASNAYFWTAQGWDGSLEMIERSRPYASTLPAHHRVRILSGSSLTTVIITIQGIMAIKTLVRGLGQSGVSYSLTINISSIFYPLAVLGLLRIFAGLWLTDDYLYLGDIGSVIENADSSPYATVSKDDPSLVEIQAQTSMRLLDHTESNPSERFRTIKSWRALIFRMVFLVPIGLLLALCLIYTIPLPGNANASSATTFLMVLFYLTWVAASFILYTFYFLSGRSTSSIIPCCNAIWYKIYTVTLMAMTLVLVILASLETRKAPCGAYTTYPSNFYLDFDLCRGIPILTEHPQILGTSQVPFGLAQFISISADDTIDANSTDDSKTIVVGFNGMCFGSTIGNTDDGAPVEPLNNTFVPTTY